MLISVEKLQKYWGVNPRSIVHVGAHNAEELQAYIDAGWGPVTWIEAQPQKVIDLLKRIPANHKVLEAAVWDSDGIELDLNVMTNTESTSLLELGTHSKEHPTVQLSHTIPVRTKTLLNLLATAPSPEMLALDIQGVELRALKGYGKKLSDVKWIYCEVNKEELYKGCALISDIDEYLATFGFRRVATRWTIHNWGDALYENGHRVEERSSFQRSQILTISFAWKAYSILMRLKHSTRKFI